MASRFADINSVEQSIEDQENENTKKKTQQNVALLKEILTLRNESRLKVEIPPKELDAYIAEFIITVRKKDSSLRSLMASFERYLRKKNYGFSIMKDAEFEQAYKALQSKQKDLKQKGKGNKPNASVALTEKEIKLLYDRELLRTSTPEELLNANGSTTRFISIFVDVRTGADPGEVKWVNFHPPFSEPPSFFFFLSLKY